jgi:hypothetical protein
MLTLEQLEALAALERRATRGPWRTNRHDSEEGDGDINWQVQQVGGDAEVICNVWESCDPRNKQDAALIAALRNAAKDLFALAREALNAPAWVSPDDQLPEDGQHVLVITKGCEKYDPRRDSAIYGERTKDFFFAVGFAHSHQVQWWMAFPKAPTEAPDTLPPEAEKTETGWEAPET